MIRVKVEAEKCEYLELDRWIKEQFISSLEDEGMKAKIIGEIKMRGKIDNITSKQVLSQAK